MKKKKWPIGQDPTTQIIEWDPYYDDGLDIESPEWYFENKEYTIWPLKNGGYWVENDDGEGMKCSEKLGKAFITSKNPSGKWLKNF